MNSKIFYGFIGLLIIGFVALVISNKQAEAPRPGIADKDFGQQHVEQKTYTSDRPPTSGPHASPVEWGVYTSEQRDDQLIHNMEHGGVIITYRPDISQKELDQLTKLLGKPYSEPNFSPKKIVLAPRSMNKSKIILSSWRRSESLSTYDKEAIIKYVKANLGKSPEPLAG